MAQTSRRPITRSPHPVQYWDNQDRSEQHGTATVTNGNLTWIENDSGNDDCYAPHEWQDDRF